MTMGADYRRSLPVVSGILTLLLCLLAQNVLAEQAPVEDAVGAADPPAKKSLQPDPQELAKEIKLPVVSISHIYASSSYSIVIIYLRNIITLREHVHSEVLHSLKARNLHLHDINNLPSDQIGKVRKFKHNHGCKHVALSLIISR